VPPRAKTRAAPTTPRSRSSPFSVSGAASIRWHCHGLIACAHPHVDRHPFSRGHWFPAALRVRPSAVRRAPFDTLRAMPSRELIPSSGVHPYGWTGEDLRIGLSGPGFRGESPWPRNADIRSSSNVRLSKSTRPVRPCTGSPSATASAAIWFASGAPRLRLASSTMTLRQRASCRSTKRASVRSNALSAS